MTLCTHVQNVVVRTVAVRMGNCLGVRSACCSQVWQETPRFLMRSCVSSCSAVSTSAAAEVTWQPTQRLMCYGCMPTPSMSKCLQFGLTSMHACIHDGSCNAMKIQIYGRFGIAMMKCRCQCSIALNIPATLFAHELHFLAA